MTMSHFLGTGPLADAFATAFMLPNLFRRLFAENSITVAFIPTFNAYLQKHKDLQESEKTKKEIKNIVKVKYNNDIYYDAGRGSNYDGYKFYTDKSLSQEIMKFDIITQFGIALHSSLGDNPYNRELTEKEKEYREKIKIL